jgi:UDP-N-acetylmuramoylalanine--D-glutamate ligase
MFEDFAGRRVTVMGLGRFGGGAGVTRWLARQGADILLTDLQSHDQVQPAIAELQPLIDREQLQLRLGEHNVSDFTTCDVVIANPAVPRPWDNRFLRAAQAAGIPITTEIRLLTERIDRSRTIGVTGSAGKSTTTAMIHHTLRRAGFPAHLGGNIGGSLLNSLDRIRANDWIVLELSSAMLYWLDDGVGFDTARGFSPHVAVLTNLEPNHLDWHVTVEHYCRSKLNIFKHQQPGDHAFTEDDLEEGQPRIALRIPGEHNQRNAHVAAAAASRATGISPAECSAMLDDFNGLPHRLQLIAEHDGLRFYNDSKSTTPDATRRAIESFDDPRSIHLIAGGYDKGSDLSAIAAQASRLAGLYTIGRTGPAIAFAAGKGAVDCGTLESAIMQALPRMRPGDILLLSPGCASWDQFANFEQRGDRFGEIISAALKTQSNLPQAASGVRH